MSKADGQKIAIQFSELLVGDVSENAAAFTVTGQQLLHRGGSLIAGDYDVASVSGHESLTEEIDLSSGTLTNTQFSTDKLILDTL